MGWIFNRKDFALDHRNEKGQVDYQVALEQCTTSAQVLDWIMQVLGKTWATDATVAGLVRQLDRLLRPQKTLCSRGVERGPIDVRKVIGEMGR